MRLHDIQETFRTTLLDEPKAVEQPPEDFAALFDDSGIAVSERLKVYRNNVVGGLSDYIVSTFPLLEKLVGEEFLKMMARAFIIQSPPVGGCLQQYGKGFGDFIDTYAPAQSLPYLPDMARFEFAMNEAYYAPDDDALSAMALAAISPDALADTVLSLRTSVRFLVSDFPLEDIRAVCLDPSLDVPDLSKSTPVRLMINRPKFDVQVVSLAEDELYMLRLLRERQTLGEALERTLHDYPDFDIQFFLKKHIDLETFSTADANSQ